MNFHSSLFLYSHLIFFIFGYTGGFGLSIVWHTSLTSWKEKSVKFFRFLLSMNFIKRLKTAHLNWSHGVLSLLSRPETAHSSVPLFQKQISQQHCYTSWHNPLLVWKTHTHCSSFWVDYTNNITESCYCKFYCTKYVQICSWEQFNE